MPPNGRATAKEGRRFQVALSFSGDHREWIEPVAHYLAHELGRERVFYDRWYEAELARPNSDQYQSDLYQKDSELIVFFFGGAYSERNWCGLEWRIGQELIHQKQYARLMLFKFDDGHVDGLLSKDGYIRIKSQSAKDIGDLILERIGSSRPGFHGASRPKRVRENTPNEAPEGFTMPGTVAALTQGVDFSSRPTTAHSRRFFAGGSVVLLAAMLGLWAGGSEKVVHTGLQLGSPGLLRLGCEGPSGSLSATSLVGCAKIQGDPSAAVRFARATCQADSAEGCLMVAQYAEEAGRWAEVAPPLERAAQLALHAAEREQLLTRRTTALNNACEKGVPTACVDLAEAHERADQWEQAVPFLDRAAAASGTPDEKMRRVTRWQAALWKVGRYDEAFSACDRLSEAAAQGCRSRISQSLPKVWVISYGSYSSAAQAFVEQLGKGGFRTELTSRTSTRWRAARLRFSEVDAGWKDIILHLLKKAKTGIRFDDSTKDGQTGVFEVHLPVE